MSEFHPATIPETTRLTPLVGRVLGLNPGLMTGPGTNTYLVGARQPLLIDTGAGVPGYVRCSGASSTESASTTCARSC